MRFLPYQSISDAKLKALENELEDKIKSAQMVPVSEAEILVGKRTCSVKV